MLFTLPPEAKGHKPDPATYLDQKQEADRERVRSAWEQELAALGRAEDRLREIHASRRAWRIYWRRKSDILRQYRSSYAALIARQMRERAALAEKIARGEL